MKELTQLQKSFIGIDVSKATLDVCIINAEGLNQHRQFLNNNTGYNKLSIWLRETEGFDFSSSLFCMEHTGIYTRQFVQYLLLKGAKVWMESALHLKRSMGMTRGKNDKIDSYRIARYAMTNADHARFVTLSNKTLLLLKDLMTSRERINKSF